MTNLHLIDTHTGGEPTRVIVAREPGSMTPRPGAASPMNHPFVTACDMRDWLRDHADWIRQSVVREPRGSESMVGAYVGPPPDENHFASVVFFNNVGYLGMCGHGLIGVVAALRHAGELSEGTVRFATPAGSVDASLHADGDVSFVNVPGYRYQHDIEITIEGVDGTTAIRGDIAYGGNWFFLAEVPTLDASRLNELLRLAVAIERGLRRDGWTGADGARIDHVELSSDLEDGEASSRNFVLCPGGHYDRSPCGTGTSAKVACLAASGRLQPRQIWVQESVIGSRFAASYESAIPKIGDDESTGPLVAATIRGRAFVTGETTCYFDAADPFRFGIPSFAEVTP